MSRRKLVMRWVVLAVALSALGPAYWLIQAWPVDSFFHEFGKMVLTTVPFGFIAWLAKEVVDDWRRNQAERAVVQRRVRDWRRRFIVAYNGAKQARRQLRALCTPDGGRSFPKPTQGSVAEGHANAILSRLSKSQLALELLHDEMEILDASSVCPCGGQPADSKENLIASCRDSLKEMEGYLGHVVAEWEDVRTERFKFLPDFVGRKDPSTPQLFFSSFQESKNQFLRKLWAYDSSLLRVDGK